MKLPFSLGSRLVFRLLFPGSVLAVALLPLVEWLLGVLGIPVERLTLLSILAVALGWLVSIADMQIYMLYEGRRFWPRWAHVRFLALEQARLHRLQGGGPIPAARPMAFGRRWWRTSRCEGRPDRERRIRQWQLRNAERRRRASARAEADIEAAAFPLEQGQVKARYPTRLGNFITQHEVYPSEKYRLDSVFFWNWIWVGLPKDLRDEIDERQAQVDGTLYVSFALYVDALLLLLYALLDALLGFRLVATIGWPALLALTAACVAAAHGLYRLSLQAHRQYGELFRAVVDRHLDSIDLKPALQALSEASGTTAFADLKGAKARRAAWAFLRWHRMRRPGAGRYEDVPPWPD